MASLCEEKEFEKAYDAHAEDLYHYLWYQSGDAELSADLVQEAFLRLWKFCANVEPVRAKAWLFKVGRNLFLNTASRKKVALNFRRQEKVGQAETPHEALERQVLRDALERAIANLSDKQREVFLLHRIDGLKYREIAELLDISVKAVEKRMHKALLNLRDQLKNPDDR